MTVPSAEQPRDRECTERGHDLTDVSCKRCGKTWPVSDSTPGTWHAAPASLRPSSAEQIVRALAAADPNHLTSTTGTLRRCTFCRASNDWPRTLVFARDHKPDCPWRLAVEWAAQDGEQ